LSLHHERKIVAKELIIVETQVHTGCIAFKIALFTIRQFGLIRLLILHKTSSITIIVCCKDSTPKKKHADCR